MERKQTKQTTPGRFGPGSEGKSQTRRQKRSRALQPMGKCRLIAHEAGESAGLNDASEKVWEICFFFALFNDGKALKTEKKETGFQKKPSWWLTDERAQCERCSNSGSVFSF